MPRKFPIEFQRVLVAKEQDYAGVAKLLTAKGDRVSRQFIQYLGDGQKDVPAKRLRAICTVLDLDKPARQKLHWAAAKDRGYEL